MEVLGTTTHGKYDVLEWQTETHLPTLENDTDLLIRVAYSDLNPVDLQKLDGNKAPGTPVRNPPFVPGYGGSGTILEVGSGVPVGWTKGARVCFLADPSRQGSYASHILVDYRCVAILPANVELQDAAAVPVAGLTAFESLAKVSLSKGSGDGTDTKSDTKTLLVIGAAGGVGSWTLVLARAWHPNLKILATASTDVQKEWCLSLGATDVFKHNEIGSKLEGGRQGSVDAIICLSEPTKTLFDACTEVIKPYGSICLVVAGKGIESLNLGFCFFKCANVVLETVFSSIRTNYQNIIPSKELSQILELLTSNGVKAPLSPDFVAGKVSGLFKDAKKANGALVALGQKERRRGKLVMKVQA